MVGVQVEFSPALFGGATGVKFETRCVSAETCWEDDDPHSFAITVAATTTTAAADSILAVSVGHHPATKWRGEFLGRSYRWVDRTN